MEELFENPYFDTYENFEQFKRKHMYLAKVLKEKFPESEWKEHPLYYYSNPRVFAKHQVKESAYNDQLKTPSIDFSEYLNWEELGRYFLEHLDKTKYYYNETTQTIVETAIHWELS
jgi:hypothetical protein